MTAETTRSKRLSNCSIAAITFICCAGALTCGTRSQLSQPPSQEPSAMNRKPSQLRTEAQAPATPSVRTQLLSNATSGKVDATMQLYVIRVVDAESKVPVTKARITVELTTPSNPRWAGMTDANGFFEFQWDRIPRSVQSHVSVNAHGFALLDSYSLLIADRLIELSRAN